MTGEEEAQRTATSPLFVLKPRLTYMHCRYLLRTQTRQAPVSRGAVESDHWLCTRPLLMHVLVLLKASGKHL